MTTTKTLREFVARVREIAANNPDFVYESPFGEAGPCQYIHTTKTYIKPVDAEYKGEDWRSYEQLVRDSDPKEVSGGCIMGQVVLDLDVMSVTDLLNHETQPVSDVVQAAYINFDEDDEESAAMILWLGNVQGKQDARKPFGDAVVEADEDHDMMFRRGDTRIERTW